MAIEVHLGRNTREHGEIDLAMLRADCSTLTHLFDEFELYIAYDGELTRWDGASLRAEHHQFWVRPNAGEAWVFELLLEQHDGDDWVYRRDPRVRRPLTDFGLRDARGVRYVRPAVALLYKSNKPEIERNQHDFDVALPVLSPTEREWLRQALELTSPGHPWLDRIGD